MANYGFILETNLADEICEILGTYFCFRLDARTTLDESEFDVWMQDPEHQRIAVEEFDNLISEGCARRVKPVYDLAFVGV